MAVEKDNEGDKAVGGLNPGISNPVENQDDDDFGTIDDADVVDLLPQPYIADFFHNITVKAAEEGLDKVNVKMDILLYGIMV